jgi:DNA-binding transcriptional ArsR family regulator
VEQPLLRLGLLGFSDDVGIRLQALASEAREGWPRWRCCDPHLADAWMINGRAVEALGRDELVIAHPFGSHERLTLHRAEVDRPLAFASPLPEGFASAEFFDASDEHSVRQRLQRFEAWLRPLRSQFALGAVIAGRKDWLRDVVHVVHEGKLLAVLDFARWQAGIFVPARPVELSMAEWLPSPATGNDIPTSFIRLPLHRLMWTYAVRTATDVLPERYRRKRIYLRRVPMVPARWFAPEHLELMRMLAQTPATFADLLERTGLGQAELAHSLAALFHSGGLTTDPESARRAENHTRLSISLLKLDGEETDSDLKDRFRGSDQSAPSSILREAIHSPLRTSNRKS